VIRVFRHYIPFSVLALLLVETGVLVLAWVLATDIAAGGGALSFGLLMLASLAAAGLYKWENHDNLRATLIRLFLAFSLSLLIGASVISLFPGMLQLDFIPLTQALALGFSGLVITRYVFLRWAHSTLLKTRVLVLGTGSRAAYLHTLLNTRNQPVRAQIVGFLPYADTQHHVPEALILRESGSLPDLADRLRVQEIVLAIRDRRGKLPVTDLLYCKLSGIRITELSSFLERENHHLQLDAMNASWVFLSDGFEHNLRRTISKRLFDLGVCLALLVTSLPFFMICALLIRLNNSGPVFCREECIGEQGRPFSRLSFRCTLTVGSPTPGVPATPTCAGRLVRLLKFDQSPQLINVLLGDMSLVGPRPESPQRVAEFSQAISYYGIRHIVQPGLTGWAQNRHRDAQDPAADVLERLQYDLYYVKNHSMFLDLTILLQTVQNIFGRPAKK
jgi:lipopolysaccharide/colanic/teichoic acid biosynthesis glycosyltransferase